MHYYEDTDIRNIYERHKARSHGWTEVVPCPRDVNGKFIFDDIETEYQRFAAGYKAAFDGTLLNRDEMYWSMMESANAYVVKDPQPWMIGLKTNDLNLAIGTKSHMVMFGSQDRIVRHNADQVQAIANGSLLVDPKTISEMLSAYAALLKAK